MAKADIAMEIQHHEDSADHHPLVKYYRASEPLPDVKPALHDFLKKGPASWAAVQISSGILSLGIGFMFAVSFNMNETFLTLFRVPIVTGILFIFTGIFSNLLYKHPGLLQMCFCSNIGCLIVSAIGVVLLSIDLHENKNELKKKVEVLVLCVMLMDMIIAAVLIFLIHKQKQKGKN